MSGQHKVPGIVNDFYVLKIGAPRGLPDRKPLWPQGDLISPRDLERDADLQEVYRTAKTLEAQLDAETQRRKRYQLIAASVVVGGASVFAFLSAPVFLSALRAWAVAYIPAPQVSVAAPVAAQVPVTPAVQLSVVPSASQTAVVEAMARNATPVPVAMDRSMTGVPPPAPTAAAQRATPGELPYKGPTLKAPALKNITVDPPRDAVTAVKVEPIAKVRPASGAATQQPAPDSAPARLTPSSTVAPRFVESAPTIQGFAGATGVLISFGDGGPVRAYRLNDILTPGENITAISPATGEITTNRRTIRK